jgi:hypothetical protein
MSDWELSAPDLGSFRSYVVGQLGITQNKTDGVLADGTVYSLNIYGTKYLPTGQKVDSTEGAGARVDEVAAQAGSYGILRWLNPGGANPPTPAAGSGVTLVALPANSPVRFF